MCDSFADISSCAHETLNEEQVRELFTVHGLRCTKQRIELYQTLAGCTSHPTAEELHSMAECGCCPTISLATVYNTLEAFCKAGLCHPISLSGSGTRYDAAISPHMHVVTPQGKVMDVPSELTHDVRQLIPDAVIQQIEQAMGVPIDRVEIQLFASQEPMNSQNSESSQSEHAQHVQPAPPRMAG